MNPTNEVVEKLAIAMFNAYRMRNKNILRTWETTSAARPVCLAVVVSEFPRGASSSRRSR